MKKKLLGIIVIGVLCTAMFRFGMVAGAATSAPGSTGDPLITQSYLEKRLSELEESLTSVKTGYKKVSVTKGKQLIVGEGSEFVIYSGEADILGEKGMINLTTGKLVKKDTKTVRYEHYLSPGKASGIKAVISCVIYVNGEYSIQ